MEIPGRVIGGGNLHYYSGYMHLVPFNTGENLPRMRGFTFVDQLNYEGLGMWRIVENEQPRLFFVNWHSPKIHRWLAGAARADEGDSFVQRAGQLSDPERGYRTVRVILAVV